MCALTTDPTEAPLIRMPVSPDEENGLREHGSLIVDKITTTPRSKVGDRIGRHADRDMVRLGRAVVASLGLADN